MKYIITSIAILLSSIVHAQSKWQPYAGLHGVMAPGGDYFGPSFQLGVDYKLKDRFIPTAFVQHSRANLKGSKLGQPENGEYRSLAAGLLLQFHLGEEISKGFFAGVGLAVLSTSDDYTYGSYHRDEKRTIYPAAIRLGHKSPFRSSTLSFELNATGPYHSENRIQAITQLSLGLRFIFHRDPKTGEK